MQPGFKFFWVLTTRTWRSGAGDTTSRRSSVSAWGVAGLSRSRRPLQAPTTSEVWEETNARIAGAKRRRSPTWAER